MEEDIKVLEEFIKDINLPTDELLKKHINLDEIEQAIENLIKRNKELEEENIKYERATDYLQTLNHKYYEDNVTLLRKNGKVDILADNIHFKYIDMVENYIPKSKVREIIDTNLKNTKLNLNGYCFSFEGCQKVAKEMFKLLQEGDK